MESIPFLHANRLFNIFFREDLAFSEVRGVLDHLLEENAFDLEVQMSRSSYWIDLDHSSFEVWVSEMDVMIERK
ncbi:MAG TPA: hypothetical protein VMC85_21515 [Desulfomonilaceae bacterium]|nr:hypothetical protein [Desulfomonilaceae bacterium]